MTIDFYNPPQAILASGNKEGVELGGTKTIVSVDSNHNFYNEGNIYTEMSWGAFSSEFEITDQIQSFKTQDFEITRNGVT